jgi:acyl-coenzyme A thioesterase 9
MRGGHVRFLSLDGIAFAQPVPIGSILRLTSYVLHSTSSAEFPMIVVGSAPPYRDDSSLLNTFTFYSTSPSQRTSSTSRRETKAPRTSSASPGVAMIRRPRFHGAKLCRRHIKVGWIVLELAHLRVTKYFSEAMLWLEGKRALEMGDEIRGLRTKYA